MASIECKPPKKIGSRGGVMMTHLTVRLPNPLNLRLLKMARKRGIPKALIVRAALEVILTPEEKDDERVKKVNKK